MARMGEKAQKCVKKNKRYIKKGKWSRRKLLLFVETLGRELTLKSSLERGFRHSQICLDIVFVELY